jgi:uncharacterized membrane protein
MRASVLVLALAGCLVACGGNDPADPMRTGATCPPASTLTYETFGAPFMESYCTRCHATDVVGADRHGAPTDHNFDTLDGILAEAEHVDAYAAAGPDATNTIMPPAGDAPSDEERLQLGEWLACETAGQ